MRSTLGEESPQPVMHVKLILSDAEILTNDGLAHKVVITNRSRSLIAISGPTFDPPFACVVEWKETGTDWREIGNYHNLMQAMKLMEPGPIRIPAGSTWAEYGQLFLTKQQKPVFGKAGKYELRARIKSAIGSYVSDPVLLHVKDRTHGENPVDERFQSRGNLFLDMRSFGTLTRLQIEDLESVAKRHPSGGVGRTLQLMLAIYTHAESGEVAGKAASYSEAFKTLSVGLDEVRHDQLAFLLAFGAMKNKQWKDVAFLIEQVDENCSSWVSRKSELESAIRRGEFRVP